MLGIGLLRVRVRARARARARARVRVRVRIEKQMFGQKVDSGTNAETISTVDVGG